MATFLAEEDVVKQVYDDYLWAARARDDRILDWDAYVALYKNFIDTPDYPYDTNLALPTAHTFVETQLNIIMDIIFGAGRFVEAVGRTINGQISAPSISDLMAYYFDTAFDIYEDMELFTRQLLVLGTSVYKPYWEYSEEMKEFEIPDFASLDPDARKKVLWPVPIKNNPNGSVVDVYNFFVDPNSAKCKNARFAGEDMWLDLDFCKMMQKYGIFHNVNELNPQDSNVNKGLVRRENILGFTNFQNSPHLTRGKIHCIDWWGYLTKGWRNGKLGKSASTCLYHVVLAVDQSTSKGVSPVCLLAKPAPDSYKTVPYVDARTYAGVGEFWGRSDIAVCEHLLLEQRDLRNLKMDNIVRNMNKMFYVTDGSGVNENELYWRPNGIVHGSVPRGDAIEVLDPGRLDPAVFSTEDQLRLDVQSATGVNDFVMGEFRSSSGFNDTATGISLIQQIALKKVAKKAQVVQRAIKQIANITYGLIQKFQSEGMTYRVLDRDSAVKVRFADVSPEALREQYDFDIVSAPSLGSKPMRQEQFLRILQTAAQIEQKLSVNIDWNHLFKLMLSEFEIPNPSAIIGFPEFNQVPNALPEAQDSQMQMPPEEENRLMVEHKQMVWPKMGEKHAYHLIIHRNVYDSIQDKDAKRLIAEHDASTIRLMQIEKEIIAAQANSEMMMQQAMGELQKAQGAANVQSQPYVGKRMGANRNSPAAGMESLVRGFANTRAGNA